MLLAVSASEVDVERLFSGCRDEFGIRRHSLKAGTVRVLTLLRSSYISEDAVDRALIDKAMQLDILAFRIVSYGGQMSMIGTWKKARS